MTKFKMGNFKGIPVYRVSYVDWRNEETRYIEEIYVVDNEVFYHDKSIAMVSGNQLVDFDEDLFVELRDKYARRRVDLERHYAKFNEVSAEVRSVEEEKPVTKEVKPVTESSEPAAAVDSFMSNWETVIDYEITKMKKDIAEMEHSYNAVG